MNRLNVARSAVTMSVIWLFAAVVSDVSAMAATEGKSQLAFGVDMARRGLWSEALFRFEQARRLDPERISILNNLAICYEAGGRFEEALATYREALRLAPENRVVKQNYSRFTEFYQGFRPRKATPPAAGAAPGPATPAAEGVDGAPAPPSPAVPPPAEPPAVTPLPPPGSRVAYRGGY